MKHTKHTYLDVRFLSTIVELFHIIGSSQFPQERNNLWATKNFKAIKRILSLELPADIWRPVLLHAREALLLDTQFASKKESVVAWQYLSELTAIEADKTQAKGHTMTGQYISRHFHQ